MSVAREREENNATLAAFVARQEQGMPPFRIGKAVVEASKLSRFLRAIAERRCNGYASPEQEAGDETRQERLRARVLALATEALGVAVVEFNTDPRGPAVRLRASFLPDNNFGGGYTVF